MDEPTQLTFLQANLEPNQWPCPTCRGNRLMLRIRYPDEIREGGSASEVCRCRTCDGQGVIDHDPDDHSVFPH